MIKAAELKAMAGGGANVFRAIEMLAKRIESVDWTLFGREAEFSGYDRRKDLVHFFSCWPAPEGGVGVRSVGLPMRTVVQLIEQRNFVLDGAPSLLRS